MANKTGIEWTDATWNPVTGCTKVSHGCKNCYAKYQAWPRLSVMPNTVYTGREFEQIACHPERLDQPLRWTKPRMIFVNSMSDLFHPDVPEPFIRAVFAIMAQAKRHTFQVLTKRPGRMREILKRWEQDGLTLREGRGAVLPNVWLGVSVEDQAAADERIPLLLDTPSAVRWISAEPLLGPVDLRNLQPGDPPIEINALAGTHGVIRPHRGECTKVDWVVVGGESGPKARPMHTAWARSLRDQCAAEGVPFLFKQWGEWAPREPYASELMESDELCGKWDGVSYRYGKKAAGRQLDDKLHDEYPIRNRV